MTKSDLKLFERIPVVKTRRLTLRRIRTQDLEDVYDYARDPELTKYLLWYPHPDISYTRSYLSYIDKGYKKGSFYDWGIELDGKMIGTVGFTSFDLNNNSAQVGYVINMKYKGQGIATEALGAIIKFGFETLGLERIYARYMIGNCASRRVMEKVGMTYEGTLRHGVFAKGSYRDVGICSIIKSEFSKA